MRRTAIINVETPSAKDEPAMPQPINEQPKKAEKQSEPLRLNRAQRRALKQHIAHKARRQAAIVKRRHDLVNWGKQCPRCGLHFFGEYWNRCQCQVESRRQCAMCGAVFMASQKSWRQTNVCKECARQIAEQWENEEASRCAAADSYYSQCV